MLTARGMKKWHDEKHQQLEVNLMPASSRRVKSLQEFFRAKCDIMITIPLENSSWERQYQDENLFHLLLRNPRTADNQRLSAASIDILEMILSFVMSVVTGM